MVLLATTRRKMDAAVDGLPSRLAARTPGYVRQIACVDGERIYSAQELQAVQHKPTDLSMSERWVRNSKSLVLCIAARRIGNALMVATGHSSGDLTLRRVVENKDDDCEEEDDEVTLDVRLGGGAVRAISMGERTLAAGSESGVVRLYRIGLIEDEEPPRIACELLAKLSCGGEVEAIALSSASKRLAVGFSGVEDNGGGLRVWDVEKPENASSEFELEAVYDEEDEDDDESEATGPTGVEWMTDCTPQLQASEVQGDVYALALRDDGTELLVGGADGDVSLWRWRDEHVAAAELVWRDQRKGPVQAVALCKEGLVVAAADHKPEGQSAAGTAALLLRTSGAEAPVSWEVELPNSRSPYCKDEVCDGGVRAQPQLPPPSIMQPLQAGGSSSSSSGSSSLWSGQWQAPVASEACPVCATAFPVVLAASLVSEEDGQATLIFGGYGRQIEKWRGVFATRPSKRLGDLD